MSKSLLPDDLTKAKSGQWQHVHRGIQVRVDPYSGVVVRSQPSELSVREHITDLVGRTFREARERLRGEDDDAVS